MLALVLVVAMNIKVRRCRERKGTGFSHGDGNVSQTGTDYQTGGEKDKDTYVKETRSAAGRSDQEMPLIGVKDVTADEPTIDEVDGSLLSRRIAQCPSYFLVSQL